MELLFPLSGRPDGQSAFPRGVCPPLLSDLQMSLCHGSLGPHLPQAENIMLGRKVFSCTNPASHTVSPNLRRREEEREGKKEKQRKKEGAGCRQRRRASERAGEREREERESKRAQMLDRFAELDATG